MDRKMFDSLDRSVKEKLRNCKSDAEIRKVIADAGIHELSIEDMEGVSGGELVVDLRELARLMGDDDW